MRNIVFYLGFLPCASAKASANADAGMTKQIIFCRKREAVLWKPLQSQYACRPFRNGHA